MGEHKKSSAQPTEVKTMANLNVTSLAAGIAHTVYVCETKDQDELDKLHEKFPEFDQSKLDA